MARTVRALVYRPGETRGEVVEIEDRLDVLQKVVGGYITAIHEPAIPGVHGYVNDEGLFTGLPFNRIFGGQEIVGPAIFLRSTRSGTEASLTDKDIVTLRSLYDED